MSYWYLKNDKQKLPYTFKNKGEAERMLEHMGRAFVGLYEPTYYDKNPKVRRMMNEGLVKNDLVDILYPVISIDEYVPSDPNTDHIVIAFYIKGVPEAVLPYTHFIELCNGVLVVDHGDSDTVKETSVVYIEMNRDRLDIKDIEDIVSLSAVIAGLEPEDFSMRFPHTDKKFPYDIKLMQEYFTSRKAKDNLEAQKEAEERAQQEVEEKMQEIEQAKQGDDGEQEKKQEQQVQANQEEQESQPQDEEDDDTDGNNPDYTGDRDSSNESVVNRMVALF